MVGGRLGKGSFGSVYEAFDVRSQTGYVIKISKDFTIMGKEIQAMKAFHSANPKDGENVPKVIAYGMFNNVIEGHKNLYSFYVMPRFGKDIDSYFTEQDKKFSLSTIVRLGIKMIDILEMVHKSGYIYGDLKLDNILAGFEDILPDEASGNAFSNVSLNLIDFGFATKYIDQSGNHLPETHNELF